MRFLFLMTARCRKSWRISKRIWRTGALEIVRIPFVPQKYFFWWHSHLIDTLGGLAKSQWPGSSNVAIQGPDRKGCGEKMALSLDIIPETSPIDFVSSLYPSNPNRMAENSIESEFNHTIIGHLSLWSIKILSFLQPLAPVLKNRSFYLFDDQL